jgi:hypothetical protein
MEPEPMDISRIMLEDCRSSWREHALKEADEMRLEGQEREDFVKKRYAELEKLGMENL